MSRTATTKQYRLSAIIGQFVILALLCLNVQSAFAQPNYITGQQIQDRIAFYSGWYEPSPGYTMWHLLLGEQHPTGQLRVYYGNTLRFENNPSTHWQTSGGAISIEGGTSYDFYADRGAVAYTTPNDQRSYLIFENNTVTGNGGAIYLSDSPLSTTIPRLFLSNIDFRNNQTVPLGEEVFTRGGGALYNQRGNIWFGHRENGSYYGGVNFDTNSTVMSGGAVYNLGGGGGGNLTFTAESDVVANASVNGDGNGQVQVRFNNNNGRVSSSPANSIPSPGVHDSDNSYEITHGYDSATGVLYNPNTRNTRNRFYRNHADVFGGAIYNENGTLTFDAHATANATATANVNANTPNNATRYGYAFAAAYAEAYAGDFRRNTAGNVSNLLGGYGGAIYNNNGTLTFTVNAVDAIATAAATATANGTPNSAWAVAFANAYAEAYAGYFSENRAERGGAIYNNPGGIITFTATGSATATSSASASSGGAANGSTANSYAYGGATNWALTWSDVPLTSFYTPLVGLQLQTIYLPVSPGGAHSPFSSLGFLPDDFMPYYGQTRAYAYSGYFLENEARLGGAIFNEGGTLSFTTESGASRISNGGSSSTGGYPNYYSWSYTNTYSDVAASVFDANRATVIDSIVADGHGGAIYNIKTDTDPNSDNGKISFYGNNRFTRNTAGAGGPGGSYTGFGGAIYNERGTLEFISQGIGGTLFGTGTLESYNGGDQRNYASLGAAIYNLEGTITMQGNHWFRYNTASNLGGAIYSEDGTVTLRGNINFGNYGSYGIDDANTNIAQGDGGAVYNLRGTFDMQGGWFYNNAALGTRGVDTGYAGAIYNNDGYVILNNVIVRRNRASKDGGAIYNTEGGTVELTNNTRFSYNFATRDGGVIYNDGGNLASISDTIFAFNTADRGGALFYANTDTGINTGSKVLTITGTTFEANGAIVTDTAHAFSSTARLGGAIYNEGGWELLIGAVYDSNGVLQYSSGASFVGNRATEQGGALWNVGFGTVANSSFTQNNDSTGTGGGAGGAIYNRFAPTATPIPVAGAPDFLHSDRNWDGYTIKFNYVLGTTNVSVVETGEKELTVTYDRAVHTYNSLLTALNNWRPAGMGALSWDPAQAAWGGNQVAPELNQRDMLFSPGGMMSFYNNVFRENSVSEIAATASPYHGAGGAIYNDGGTLTFTGNNLFGANRAYYGGAIFNNGGQIEITGGALGGPIADGSNTARFGGAIYNTRRIDDIWGTVLDHNGSPIVGTLLLRDVDFLGNQATVSGGVGGLGGAIYNREAAITLEVTAGLTSTFQGNYSGATTKNESIYFAGAGNVFDVTVGVSPSGVPLTPITFDPRDVTVANGLLNMFDPMNGGTGTGVVITKDGLGTWLLAGVSDFSTGTAQFRVEEGTLYLHLHEFLTATTSEFVNAELRLGAGNFRLDRGATLAVDGVTTLPVGTTTGTQIQANQITLASGSALTFNLTEVDILRSSSSSNPLIPRPGAEAVLKLDAATVNVLSTVNVYLTDANPATPLTDRNGNPMYVHDEHGNPVLDGFGVPIPVANWWEWFDEGNELYLIDGVAGKSIVGAINQWNYTTNAWEVYTAVRDASGYIAAFSIDDGWLKTESERARFAIYWTGIENSTGDPNDIWDSLTDNWYAWATFSGGRSTTFNFFEEDLVVFANRYDYYEDGVFIERRTVDDSNKIVSLYQGIFPSDTFVVGALDVTGTGYVFDIESGVTLYSKEILGDTRPTGYIDFGSATVNMATDTVITADDSIDFGAESILNVVRPGTSSAKIAAGTSITFAGNTVLGNDGGIRFDLTGATVGMNPMLTMDAPAIDMNNSFHHIVQAMGDVVATVPLQNGQSITLLETVGTVSGLNNVVIDGNGHIYIPQRADGILYEFIVNAQDDLVLRGSLSSGWNLMWTGDVDGEWNTFTNNWLGDYTSAGVLGPNRTYTFGNGDFVLFDESYIDEYGDEIDVLERNITLGRTASLVNVGSMGVLGADYVFTLMNGVELAAEYSIAFGTATVDMGAGSTISANDMIAFGTLTDTSTISVALDTTIRANTILFTHDHDFTFDLTGASDQDVILKLEGNVSVATSSGVIGGGNIFVDNLPSTFGYSGGTEHIVLIQIDGTGAVTSSGSLMVWNPVTGHYEINTPQRSDVAGATMLGLGVDNPNNPKELWLLVADANGNTDLHWTGNAGTVWDTVSTNWAGVLNGINVATFWHGDSVVFDNRAGNDKTVVMTGEMRVGSMKVADSGYLFDLRKGGIAAERLTWHDGNQTNGTIDFGNGTTLISGVNTVISADGTITFGQDLTLEFDLNGAVAGDVILDLQGTVVVDEGQKIGSGDIYVFNTPALDSKDYVVLADAGAGNVVRTGTLFLWDPYKFDNSDWRTNPYTTAQRSTYSGIMMFGLDTNEDDSQLLLKWIDASTNSYNLTWTGAGNRIWDVESQNNWKGTVEGIFNVTTFLNGDTVYFDNTAVNKNVILGEGGVGVHSMFVQGSGYNFDMRLGGIAAVGDPTKGEQGVVHLNDASLLIAVRYEEPTNEWEPRIVAGFTQITADAITVNGTSVELADASKIDPKLILQSEDRFVDFEILVSKEEAIDGTVVSNVKIAHNPFYIGEFFIDNDRTPGSGFGILRLKYFYFEGWNHNTNEAAKALNILRDTWIAEDEGNYDLFNLLAANPLAAANQLRGSELVANSASMAMWNPWEITHQRLRTIRNETGWNTWGEGYYRFANVDSDKNALKFDLYRGGTMIGADYGANRYWQFGGAFGYAIPKIENAYGKIDADDVTVGLYSKINFFDQAYVSTFLGYGYQGYKMERYGFDGYTHRGSYSGDTGYASVEFTRPLYAGSVGAIIPLIAIDHQTTWTNKFTETGQWGQSMAGTRMGRTMLRFGVDSKWDAGDAALFGTFDVSTRLQLAVLLDGDRKSKVTSYFPMTGASMELYGTDMGWAQANIGITASGEYRSKYRWFIDLDGYATDRMLALQAAFGLSTRW